MSKHANTRARSSAAASKSSRRSRAARWARVAVVAAAPVLGAGALAAPAVASQRAHDASAHYNFVTLDNQGDVTFNQLLGINDRGLIAGYFGSGMAGHPNKGYLLTAPYGQGSYHNENWPESTQTQVTGLNDHGVTVGFWSSMNTASQMNNNVGFVDVSNQLRNANFPTGDAASPPVDQLLGVNDGDVAVGFFTDANGNNHGYEYNIADEKFSSVTDPSLPGASLTAAAINDSGDIAGFYTNAAGATDGFLKTRNGQFTDLAVPGASSTMALGVNGRDEVVGTYLVGPAARPPTTVSPGPGRAASAPWTTRRARAPRRSTA
jgi:hypothetical protein